MTDDSTPKLWAKRNLSYLRLLLSAYFITAPGKVRHVTKTGDWIIINKITYPSSIGLHGLIKSMWKRAFASWVTVCAIMWGTVLLSPPPPPRTPQRTRQWGTILELRQDSHQTLSLLLPWSGLEASRIIRSKFLSLWMTHPRRLHSSTKQTQSEPLMIVSPLVFLTLAPVPTESPELHSQYNSTDDSFSACIPSFGAEVSASTSWHSDYSTLLGIAQRLSVCQGWSYL